MRKYFPHFQTQRGSGVVTWLGDLQPTPVSKTYTIKLTYGLNYFPKVWVISPDLIKRSDSDKIPHTYSANRLCLFYPKHQEWLKDMHISKTILPWTSLWLYYYEIWLAVGLWLGGGIHPPRNNAG
jgi:hypothetical protein